MSKNARQSEWVDMIDDCENRDTQMSEWEQGFISSVSTQLGNDRFLTDKQDETLTDIWRKVTENG